MPATPERGIGSLLRHARSERGLSIEEVAWRLRIRPEKLRALEDEQFSHIGHEGFVRAHLRSYAKAVGLDAGEIVRLYRRRPESQDLSPIQALDQKNRVARKQRPRSRWVPAAAIASVLLIAASVVGFLRGPGAGHDVRPSTFPAGPRVAFEQASRAVKPLTSEQVRVRIAAVKATQVTVVVDGKRTFQGTLSPGASQVYTAIKSVLVSVDDSRSIQIWTNDARYTPPAAGRWQGTFGRFGLVSP